MENIFEIQQIFSSMVQFYVGLPHIYAYFKICVQSIRRQLILAPIIPGNFHKNQHSTKGKQKKRKPKNEFQLGLQRI